MLHHRFLPLNRIYRLDPKNHSKILVILFLTALILFQSAIVLPAQEITKDDIDMIDISIKDVRKQIQDLGRSCRKKVKYAKGRIPTGSLSSSGERLFWEAEIQAIKEHCKEDEDRLKNKLAKLQKSRDKSKKLLAEQQKLIREAKKRQELEDASKKQKKFENERKKSIDKKYRKKIKRELGKLGFLVGNVAKDEKEWLVTLSGWDADRVESSLRGRIKFSSGEESVIGAVLKVKFKGRKQKLAISAESLKEAGITID